MALGTITSLGVGSKLDLQGVLDQLRAVDETAINAISNKKTTANNQLVAFDTVNSKLLAVKSQALTLSLESNFLSKKVSGDASVVSATVGLGTADASHEVEVLRLATKSSFQSTAVDSAETVIANTASTFDYRLGTSPDTVSVAVDAGTTLSQLAELINDDPNNPGVTASLVDTGEEQTPFRLLVTAQSSGEAQRINVLSSPTDLAFTELQGANGASLNAALQVDGVNYERQSHTGVTDVLQGLTLNLQGTGSTTLQVSSDTSSIKEAITGLVTTFQEALQEITTQTTFNRETGSFGSLGTSTGLRSTRRELTTLLGSIQNTGNSITSLVDLGLTFERDGSVALDEGTLDKVLSENFEAVRTLFVGEAGAGGIGTLLTDKLTDITQFTGLIATEKQATQANVDRLDASITTAKARLDQRYDTLARQFTALDSFAARLQQQGDSLNSFIDSLNSTRS